MASGTRGYSSYRGRGRKGKIFLAILLILIILGSVGFIMAREHMRYDADGNLHFDLPWDKGTSDPVEAPRDPDVVIREPEQTAVKTPVRGTLLAAKPLTMEDQETAETPLSEMTVTAVTLKDSTGRVYFDSSTAVTGAVSVKPDTGEALNDLTARTDVTAAARIACFHDPKAANADVEGMGLKNTGGYIFYDGNNSQWLDPGHEKARTYLLNIIREAAEQGFREIILTDVNYPTAGKLDKIDFSNAMTAGNTAEAGRQVQIEGFLREVRDALPKNVILLNAIGFVIFFFQGLMNLAIVVMINNTIEYDEARFHERHDSVISAVRSFSVKLAGGINQGLSTLVLIVSGVYVKSQSISALEIEVNKGNLSSEKVLAEANKYIGEITAQQALIFRMGMVLIPVFALIISYVIIKKKYHIDEAEYARLIRKK